MINGSCRFQKAAGLCGPGKAAAYHDSQAGTCQPFFFSPKTFLRRFRGDFLQSLIGFVRGMLFGEPLACISSLKTPLFFVRTRPQSAAVAVLVLLSLPFPSCSRNHEGLEYRVRQQAAAIQSLNQEIERLNDEILQLIAVQESLQKENALLRENSSTTP
jgi:hypothetical protein